MARNVSFCIRHLNKCNVINRIDTDYLKRSMHVSNNNLKWFYAVCLFGAETSMKIPSYCFTLRHSGTISFRKYSFYSNIRMPQNQLERSSNENSEVDAILEDSDEQHAELMKRMYRVPGMGHSVLVIQPRVKWGPKKKVNTTSDLQIAEAVALVETLPGWKVLEKVIIPVLNPEKKFLFGSGNAEILKNIVNRNCSISAVFISQDILNSHQTTYLEDLFGVPVYDRYTIVLQIFRDHAQTKEAKLQIALAEIPYLRARIKELHNTGKNRESGGTQHIGGAGETFLETRKRVLFYREMKIKRALENIKKRRHLLRQNRLRKELPIVAVVGYTNSGKTSLIKALTEDSSMEPKDQLFATLDVTAHAGLLPSFQKVVYIDTVGFISDIPTSLIHSFAATLEDVALADLVVHIRDISHPDAEAQKHNVIQTLAGLNLPNKLLDSMIEVCNKVDLVDSTRLDNFKDSWLVSATCSTGLEILQYEIQRRIMENNRHLMKVFRVPSGGQEFTWLYKETAVKAVVADKEDPNYLFVEVTLTPATNAKFIHKFGNLTCETCIEEEE